MFMIIINSPRNKNPMPRGGAWLSTLQCTATENTENESMQPTSSSPPVPPWCHLYRREKKKDTQDPESAAVCKVGSEVAEPHAPFLRSCSSAAEFRSRQVIDQKFTE